MERDQFYMPGDEFYMLRDGFYIGGGEFYKARDDGYIVQKKIDTVRNENNYMVFNAQAMMLFISHPNLVMPKLW